MLPFKQYTWQLPGFPAFTWDQDLIARQLATVIFKQGQLLGTLNAIGFEVHKEAAMAMTIKAIRDSSGIEGEQLPYPALRSSVGKKLNMAQYALVNTDARIDAIVTMMADAVNLEKPCSEDRILGWHELLFPDGPQTKAKLYHVGEYRKPEHDPMVVVSTSGLKETFHFQAPPAEQVPELMAAFVNWCQQENQGLHPLVKSGIAHLWFTTIHPFDDGNGRIGRAIADFFIAQSDGQPHRYYSVSSAILKDRKQYYQQLEQASKSGLDITHWLVWYLRTILVALLDAEESLAMSLNKARFWSNNTNQDLNDRQKKVLNLLLDGFTGKLNTTKYAALTKTSQDTAARDLHHLVQQGMLEKLGQGKATHYQLVLTQSSFLHPIPNLGQ